MELAGLGAKAAILVPTPGQSEQEHLAAHLESMGACVRMEQGAINLASARAQVDALPGFRRWRDAGAGSSGLASFLSNHILFQDPAAAPIRNASQQ
jgi:hypothetical protein